MSRRALNRGFALLSLLLLDPRTAGASKAPAPPASDELASAIRTMRKIDVKRIPAAQQEAKAEALSIAWDKLVAAGPAGADALSAELKKMEARRERDDYFKLGAAVVLWQIGQASYADPIAALWRGDVDLTLNYRYVFHTAFGAARTRDPKVLPMLIAVLRDRKGHLDLPEHAMPVRWPRTHAYVWGAFGAQGVAPLRGLLSTTKDVETLASAMELLGVAQDEAALPAIRKLATTGPPATRISALRALGLLGHPADFDLLVAAVKSKDPEVVFASTYALFEYGDLRAVPALTALLDSPDKALGGEVAATLGHLLTPEGIEALTRCAGKGAKELRPVCQETAAAALHLLGTTDEKWKTSSAAARGDLTAKARRAERERHRLGPDDRKLSREELQEALTEWTVKRSLEGGAYGWVEDRHLLAVTTAADIPLLLDLQAAVITRLSDAGLEEVHRLQRLVLRLGRLRYRKEPGVCKKVEGKAIPEK